MARVRAMKPPRAVGGDWRGGRIIAVDGATLTVRLRAEANVERDYTIAKALYPNGIVNDPIVARISNAGSALADYIMAEVRGTTFLGGAEHTEAHPNIGHVPYWLTGESEVWWTE